MQELSPQLICGISHVDVGIPVRCCRDFVLVIKFVGIKNALHRVEGYRLVADIWALNLSGNAGITAQRCAS